MTTYTLAGGCFWCLEAVFQNIKGVTGVVSGYAGGTKEDATYARVCSGETNHAEAVQVTFAADVIPPAVILDIFFVSHDPTSLNRQGHDLGRQYRSALFYQDEDERQLFTGIIAKLAKNYANPIVTVVEPLTAFYPAESEHSDYFRKHPERSYCQLVIAPKVAKVEDLFATWQLT